MARVWNMIMHVSVVSVQGGGTCLGSVLESAALAAADKIKHQYFCKRSEDTHVILAYTQLSDYKMVS